MTFKRQLFSPEEMVAAIQRMAAGIRSAFPGEELDDIAFLGLYQQGVPLAERLARHVVAKHVHGVGNVRRGGNGRRVERVQRFHPA